MQLLKLIYAITIFDIFTKKFMSKLCLHKKNTSVQTGNQEPKKKCYCCLFNALQTNYMVHKGRRSEANTNARDNGQPGADEENAPPPKITAKPGIHK